MSSTAFYRHANGITHEGKLEVTELLTVTGIVPGLLMLFGLGFECSSRNLSLEAGGGKYSCVVFCLLLLSIFLEYVPSFIPHTLHSRGITDLK